MGRKSIKDEIQAVKYITALAPKAFAVIEACLGGDDKADRKWGAEQMTKLVAKALPTTIEGDEENPLKIQITGMKIIQDGHRVQDEERKTD
jgi:hypothetical protein